MRDLLTSTPPIIRNAKRLLADADLLAENGRYASAFVLATLALEEVGKVVLGFQHYEAGLMDLASYESAVRSMKIQWLSQPVYRAIWALQAAITAPSTRKVIDDMLGEVPLAGPRNLVALFEEELSKVLAEGGQGLA